MSGPAPLPENAPATSFSAARALTFERELLGGDVPHPVGTAAHDAIRDRLAAQFRALGYDVTIQRTFACSAWVTCSPIANVIARTPGDARPNALVLATHYDSVPAGPGVSDDGVGVGALLETARALRNERFRNPIVYLVTDAEEVALLGAEGFVADPRTAAKHRRRHQRRSARHERTELPLRDQPAQRVAGERDRACAAAAGHQLVLLRHLRTAAERYRPHRLQTRRPAGCRLRAHRTSGSLPLAARQLRERDAVDGAASRRSHAGDGARAGGYRSSPDAARRTRSGSTCSRSS